MAPHRFAERRQRCRLLYLAETVAIMKDNDMKLLASEVELVLDPVRSRARFHPVAAKDRDSRGQCLKILDMMLI